MSLTIIQAVASAASILGIVIYGLSMFNVLLICIGYFLFSGIGVSLMMHRYWTHRSFKFKSKIIERIFTVIAILAGRGSPIGWVYVHRLHHMYSDTLKDPHDADTVGWRIFLPHTVKYGETIDNRVIRDLFDKEHLIINKYYMGFIILWSALLLVISPQLFFFLYAVPVMLTFISLDLFVLLTHKYGYRNFNTKDKSKNHWFISLILWGEGWHNNHHHNPKSYTTKIKWWEFDPLAYVIKLIKL